MRRVGYCFEELFMWHNPGSIGGSKYVEPSEFWENADTKRRIHNLLAVTGVLDKLVMVRARPASRDEILQFHTPRYHDQIMSDSRARGGDGGDLAPFSKGVYEIACLSAGGVMAGVEAVLNGTVDNAYCLVRPPGHHAEADRGRGFCLFNNIVLAAFHAKKMLQKEMNTEPRIAIVDYDVHHGNGTQQAFWSDPNVLFISIHQDSNYPIDSGLVNEIGGSGAEGSTINIPLPPGSGSGAYSYAFDTIVIPAVQSFNPDIILVSSGFDASYSDPLAAMILSSKDFGSMANKLVSLAEECCQGRIVFAHEGGYSKDYVPFCGLAVIESLLGESNKEVEDPCLCEVENWGYQECQLHQKYIIDKVVKIHNKIGQNWTNNSTTCNELSEIEKTTVNNMKQLLLDNISDHNRRQLLLNTLLSDV